MKTDEAGVGTVRDRVPLDHGLTLGRQAMAGQVVLDHPNVSRRHAAFEIVDGTVVLRDLGGTNGTYVNGERLRRARHLVEGDRIDIGPFQLTFDGAALIRVGRAGNVELLVRGVSYDVRGGQARGVPRRILHGANLHILPSEFVVVIGSNGSGKSTLMNIIAGRVLPSEGTVLLNDRDLHANFLALKQDIAFVPQQDVLHEQLTLRQALDYTAQLRLPPDTTVEQRRAAVNEAARSVDLLAQLDQRIGALSGGQKKRASLASEILNRPSLLLLDEVTSGLDESTDWQIMRLLRRLADGGVTIVVVTHTLANVPEFCDKVICMGRGGQPTFVGAPSEVLEFFSVRRLGEVFDRTDELGAECWRVRFEGIVDNQSSNHRRIPRLHSASSVATPPRSGIRDTAACDAPGGNSTTSEYNPVAVRSSYIGDGCGSERAHRRPDGLRVRSLWDGAGACQRGERSAAAAWPERDLARL
jgi:ABC-type multidrug transport system ATPase subunit